jgi:hypothetical protein
MNYKREPRIAADERGYGNCNDNSNNEPRMTRINADRTGRAERSGAPGQMIFFGGAKESFARQP